jgi:hypothetical protein
VIKVEPGKIFSIDLKKTNNWKGKKMVFSFQREDG